MSSSRRLSDHPILPVGDERPIARFTWRGREHEGRAEEMLSSALLAAGVDVFGHHPTDGAALGIFCANGQCAQCTVVADGHAVKSCLTPLEDGMALEPCEGRPELPLPAARPPVGEVAIERPRVLVIGAGPAGLSAAIELGRVGVDVLVVDDKDRPGGKLVLQTHKFFGSTEETRAGMRGIDIARELAEEVAGLPTVDLRLESTVVGIFSDGRVGVVTGGSYTLVEPEVLLVATGARERQVPFAGHTLPGVYGAGAFQTLLNRDRVVPCERLFVLGGGNVGLIAAYHALQADIEVVGLCEAMPRIGGYRVHADKLRRLGVPVHLGHTIVAAGGRERVETVTIAAVDRDLRPVVGTERTFAVDTILVAVGLAPLDEFLVQAQAFGMRAHAAGDASGIAEASAATFSGRIAARRIALDLGLDVEPVPDEWLEKLEALRARPEPGRAPVEPPAGRIVYPVLRCTEEIPCNPCVTICPKHAIEKEDDPLRGTPRFTGGADCVGCDRCVAICPGLAITLVDGRRDPERPTVTVAYEQSDRHVEVGATVVATDGEGVPIGRFEVLAVRNHAFQDRTRLVDLRADRERAPRIAGIRVQDPEDFLPIEPVGPEPVADDVVICRCERVTAGAIRSAIAEGVRDVNEMKARLRVCMGACCGKNCPEHIDRLFREAGVDPREVTSATRRPLFVEVPFGVFAAGSGEP